MKLLPLVPVLLAGLALPVIADTQYFRLGLGAPILFQGDDGSGDGGGVTTPGPLQIEDRPATAKYVSEYWYYTPKATGGDGDYTWSATMPTGTTDFTFQESSGSVYGSTAFPGNYSFELTVTDGTGATDSQTIVAEILPPTNGPSVPDIGSDGDINDGGTGDPNVGDDLTDDDDGTSVDLGPGDGIDIEFDDPTIVDVIDIDIWPVGGCGSLRNFVVAAYVYDDMGNKKEVDRLVQTTMNCISGGNEPNPPPRPSPTPFKIESGVRWTEPYGWFLRSTCRYYVEPTMMSGTPWPSLSTAPSFSRSAEPGDVYAGDHCIGGQYGSPKDPSELENNPYIGFWYQTGCITGGACRYAHVRSYVQFDKSRNWSTGVPSWKPVKFSGGAYRKLRLEVVSVSDGTKLRMDNLNLSIPEPVSVTMPATAKVRMPNSLAVPYSTGGGHGTYTVSCSGLPAGMQCLNGEITGTPSAPGTYTVTVKAADATNSMNVGQKQIGITVHPELVPSVGPVLSLIAGEPINHTLRAQGAVGAVTWSLAEDSAALPGTLALASDGTITGSIPTSGTWTGYNVRATDTEGTALTGEFNIVASRTGLGFNPEDPYGAHRYWGIEMLSGGANGIFSIADLTFAAEPGGEDMTEGGTPGISSLYSTSYPATHAFDASTSTFTSTKTSTPGEKIWYDFGKDVRVHEMSYHYRISSSQYPTDWNVIYSDDGENWQTAWRIGYNGRFGSSVPRRTFTSPDYGFPREDGPMPYGKHRYWGLQFKSGGSNSVYTIGGLEMRVQPGGANVAKGGDPASLAQHSSSSPATMAFDPFTSTLYSVYISSPQLLWFDFREGHEVGISEIAMYPWPDSTRRAPLSWDVLYSDDGENWHKAWSDTTPAWTAEWRTFTSPDLQ